MTAVVDFDNVFYTHVLKELQLIIRKQFDGRTVYINPEKLNDNKEFSVRIWGLDSELDEQYAGLEGWRRKYNTEIVLYQKIETPNDLVWEQFFRDTERLQQLLYNNTKIDGSSNLGWFEGNVTEMIIGADEVIDDEKIYAVRFEFSCRINRHS